jgi:hypothetical protein
MVGYGRVKPGWALRLLVRSNSLVRPDLWGTANNVGKIHFGGRTDGPDEDEARWEGRFPWKRAESWLDYGPLAQHFSAQWWREILESETRN